MPDNGQLIEKNSISMYPSDWAIVDGADTNDGGRSATLRMIVREWHQMTRRLVQNPLPHVLYDAQGADPRFRKDPETGILYAVEKEPV